MQGSAMSTLWHLSHVKNTKYFQIRSMASDGTHATLIASESGNYMYASINTEEQND